MNTIKKIIEHVVCNKVTGQSYEAGRLLADLHPTSTIVEVDDYNFCVATYAKAGKCSLILLDEVHNQVLTSVDRGKKHIEETAWNAYFEIHWRGVKMSLVTLGFDDSCVPRRFLIADRRETAEEFVLEVCDWRTKPHGGIMVYVDGGFKVSKALAASVSQAKLDDLILAPETVKQLTAGCEGFFQMEEVYAKYGIPWKRGVLLTGPPGNGKTQAIKAMVSKLGKPCIYVRGFRSSYGTDEENMGAVFQRVRRIAPCIVVMEDIDSLVQPAQLSYLLNELDGFSDNHGVLVIGTTNHPDRLDTALLERPSRFDRKVLFNLPGPVERRRYLQLQATKWEDSMSLGEKGLEQVVQATDGYSFAYLKELCLSAMLAWFGDGCSGEMSSTMLRQAEGLRSQMAPATLPLQVEDEDDEDDEDDD